MCWVRMMVASPHCRVTDEWFVRLVKNILHYDSNEHLVAFFSDMFPDMAQAVEEEKRRMEEAWEELPSLDFRVPADEYNADGLQAIIGENGEEHFYNPSSRCVDYFDGNLQPTNPQTRKPTNPNP
eukprot:Sspe_Gene.102468::Locus_77857_Transcript_1_1_Confidence_1.000_Length_759::g.102468::m.102468